MLVVNVIREENYVLQWCWRRRRCGLLGGCRIGAKTGSSRRMNCQEASSLIHAVSSTGSYAACCEQSLKGYARHGHGSLVVPLGPVASKFFPRTQEHVQDGG